MDCECDENGQSNQGKIFRFPKGIHHQRFRSSANKPKSSSVNAKDETNVTTYNADEETGQADEPEKSLFYPRSSII